MTRLRTLVLSATAIVGLVAQSMSLNAQDPSVPQITLPPPPHSVRSAKPVPGMITVHQDGFPAEVTQINQGAANWVDGAQVYSRTHAVIVALRLGWAYALPNGLEFHQSEVLKPESRLLPGSSYQSPAQNVPARAEARNLLLFVDQVTFADASIHSADHAKVAAFYKDCCTGANAGRVPPIPQGRPQTNVPGGAIGHAPVLTPGLEKMNFDVVSFRRTERPGRGREFPSDGDFIAYHGSNIVSLILFAHVAPLGYTSVTGQPDWANTEYYDFQAKVAPEDVAAWKAMPLTDKRAMVGRMLADTLKLKIHQQMEPQPVYELVVTKGGPRLMDYHAGDTVTFPGRSPETGHFCGSFAYYRVCQDATIADLVNTLTGSDRSGRAVIDKTGLTGAYNFTVPMMTTSLPPQLRQALEDAGLPSLAEGLKQLGLALVPAKGPVDEIVVDHIERPDTN